MAEERAEPLAWDRVGRFLQQTGSKGSDIAARNLKLWASISANLKKDDKYTADDMADDLAKSMTTAMNNLSDIWLMLTSQPRQNRLAQSLPTAFLLFDRTEPQRHRLLEPVRIEVDFDLGGRKLPPRAKIALNGTATARTPKDAEPENSAKGVDGLQACLVARLDDLSSAYFVETVNYNVDAGARNAQSGDRQGLVPGVYDGIVYLVDPPLALANLRILVEGDPPDPKPDVGGVADASSDDRPSGTS